MATRKLPVTGSFAIEGIEYVVIPKVEYVRLRDQTVLGTVDAHTFVRGSIASDLRAARETAKLTQAELAERLGKSQTLVSQAESGTARVSERYVRAVLKACGFSEDWRGQKPKGAAANTNATRKASKKRSRTRRAS